MATETTRFEDIDAADAKLNALKRERSELKKLKTRAVHSGRGWKSQEEREETFSRLQELGGAISRVRAEFKRLLAEGQRPSGSKKSRSMMTCPSCGGPTSIAGKKCDGCQSW